MKKDKGKTQRKKEMINEKKGYTKKKKKSNRMTC